MQERKSTNSRGIDISHYQGQVDWAKVKQSGISFAIMKATEGSTFTDDALDRNMTEAKENGIARGMYHFCRASTAAQAAAEAEHFCSVLDQFGGISALDIPPVLDIETAVAQTKEQITAICKSWLTIIEDKCKVKPIIYCDPSFAQDWLDDSLGEYPLWLASWSEGTPKDRCGWKEWTFLQYTDKGRVDGINGPVDLNEYNGDVSDFMATLSIEDANKGIAIAKTNYALAVSDADREEWHRWANELRKASGQPLS